MYNYLKLFVIKEQRLYANGRTYCDLCLELKSEVIGSKRVLDGLAQC